MTMTDYVIIVAGGKGLRMGGDVPKQFLPVAGLPVLMRTMLRFREYSPALNIILVLPKAQQDYWQGLCQQHQFGMDYQLADGGRTRFHSVLNGLALIPDEAEGVVGVHDGVRPFVSADVISRCYEQARVCKAVVPVVPVVETLRRIGPAVDEAGGQATAGDMHSVTVPRADYRLVQTPQVFSIATLKAAYAAAVSTMEGKGRQQGNGTFTDDASVVEALGQTVTLVEGNRENIKLTTPFDMQIAETLIH